MTTSSLAPIELGMELKSATLATIWKEPDPVEQVQQAINKLHSAVAALISGETSGTSVLPEPALPGTAEQQQAVQALKLSHCDWDPASQESVRQFLMKFADVFCPIGKYPGTAHITPMEIPTDGSPAFSRMHRRSPKESDWIDLEVDKMLVDEVVQPSSSPWASPVVVVKKKDSSYRFCVDYRSVNGQTKKDVYPLPRVDDILDTLGKSSVFSVLDAASGYWQIPIKEDDREKTAFQTRRGLFHFNVMPFGLTNAPAKFQREMDRVLSGLTWQLCLVYLDDIIVFSKSTEQHFKDLAEVFERLRKAGIKVKHSKCRFFASEVTYLGHVISGRGVQPEPEKVQNILGAARPTSVKQLRSFLGLSGYYRRFIKNYAQIAAPLLDLLRKEIVWDWSPSCDLAFEKLKVALTSTPILAFPDLDLPFILYTDASKYAVGSVLAQIQNGREVVIAYRSRTLDKHQKAYTVTEKEAFAVVDALEHFKPYLHRSRVQVYTDHNPLTYIRSKKAEKLTERLVRWAMKLTSFDADIIYRPGAIHANADAVSREPIAQVDKEDLKMVLLSPEVTIEQVKNEQVSDSHLSVLINFLKSRTLPDGLDAAGINKIVQEAKTMFLDEEGMLYKVQTPTEYNAQTSELLVIPKSLRKHYLAACHDSTLSGHLGVTKTLQSLKQKYWWKNMRKDVRQYINSCKTCQSSKNPTRSKGELQPIVSSSPFEIVGMDFVGPLNTSENGNSWIVTLVDLFTGYTELKAISAPTEHEAALFFYEQMICRHGAPSQLITDKAATFMSNFFTELNRILEIRKTNTSGYHPQTNGATERMHATLERMLRAYVNIDQDDWDIWLPSIQFAINNNPHATTHHSPHFLVHGVHARMPWDLRFPSRNQFKTASEHEWVRELTQRMQEAHEVVRALREESRDSQRARYNLSRSTVEFEDGSLVWLYVPAVKPGLTPKLTNLWQGPYEILEKKSPVTYKLLDRTDRAGHRGRALEQVVHVNRLKRFISRDEDLAGAVPELEPSDDFDAAEVAFEVPIDEAQRALIRKRFETLYRLPHAEDAMEVDTDEPVQEQELPPLSVRQSRRHLSKQMVTAVDLKVALDNIRAARRIAKRGNKQVSVAGLRKMLASYVGSTSNLQISMTRKYEFDEQIKQLTSYEEIVTWCVNFKENFEKIFSDELAALQHDSVISLIY